MCEYPANDLYSLGEHVGEFHSENPVEEIGWAQDDADEPPSLFTCLIYVRKGVVNSHPETFRACRFFLQGN